MPTSASKYQYIVCDPDLCVGCQICEYICSFVKTGEFNTYRSRIRVVRIPPVVMTSITCRTCEDAPCVVACPRDALTQIQETGAIQVDEDACDGCGWCIEACDFGAISLNPATKLGEICDLCVDEEDGPQCVKWCPKEALSLSTAEIVAQKARKGAVSQLLQELVAG
jgi:Fe-S-cluster-containing hydrogenase component 2